MKHVARLALLLLAFGTTRVHADPCKPARLWTDKITKETNVQWEHNLTKKGFWKSMVATDIDLWVIIFRSGTSNALSIQITATTNDRDEAALNSRFRAAKGDRFIFGLKGGTPLTFQAAVASNKTQLQSGEGLVMTTVLSADVSDGALAQFREAITTKKIDAIRILLASGALERDVDESNGQAMLEKFSCFYQYLDKTGVVLTAGAGGTGSASTSSASVGDTQGGVQERYTRRGKSSDSLDLRSDGTFALHWGTHDVGGQYRLIADKVELDSMSWPDKLGVMARKTTVRTADTVTFADGNVFEKSIDTPTTGPGLTVDQVVQMAAAKLPDDVLVAAIQGAKKMNVTTDDLLKLKKAGVSDAVIRAIVR